MKKCITILMLFLCLILASSAGAQEEDQAALAKKTQNPVSDLISLPFQNNFNFGLEPDDKMQYILNIQPVVPLKITERLNIINRPIIPVIYQPKALPWLDEEFGLGDIQYQAYLSPRGAGKFVWGVGPIVQFPSATDDVLGTGKWSIGPGGVLVFMPGKWVIGSLINNIFSIGGDDDRNEVNLFTWQYFINYNLPHGWYLTTGPIMTANWEASSENRWTVPIGCGFGKIWRLGKLPINTQVTAYYNVERPDNTADWQLRLQVQFLFPKGKR